MVQAFTILRKKYLWSAELYLAGAKESDIRDALRERQIRVEEADWQKIHLLGDLGSEKLTDYYNLCDVFCMPSYFEAYGLVFAEALTYGLPCIGRDKFAMSEFIEDGCTGRLISGEDAVSYTHLISDWTIPEAIWWWGGPSIFWDKACWTPGILRR